ncbi:MAG TPA: hypothetical protein VFE72_04965 [Lysobacter sp.]|nr:hypothetical protein [Lysobacter sp.]
MTPVEVTPALCQRCAACCSSLVDGELVACKHLIAAAGGFGCAIYAARPAVCRDYSCVRDGQLSPAVADRVLAAAGAA